MQWTQVLASRMSRMKASEIRELLKLLDQPEIISFAGGIPDPALFPKDAYQNAFASALTDKASMALQYSTSEGYAPLREWIAGEMARIGIPCTPDNILITSGSQQALDYLGKLMLSPGDTALVNWPTYLGALGAFNAYEPRYDKLVPGSNQDPAELKAEAEAAGGKVKFAYLSADFANPTGITITREERERLIDLGDALDIAVIEDAAYQTLRFDGEAIPPILALEIARKGSIEDCRTIYCGSFSKSLAPGLRIGWICAASDIVNRLVLLKQAADLQSSTINQIVTEEVARTHLAEHAAMLRRVYAGRRDHMIRALEREMPEGVTFTRPEGGMFVWVTVPAHIDCADLLATSLKTEKVAFVPGRAFYADGSMGNTMRLSFSCANEQQIDEGITRLGRLIRAA